jgi:hypothetical protein
LGNKVLVNVKKREYAVLHKVSTTGWFTGRSKSESKINHLPMPYPAKKVRHQYPSELTHA